MKSDKELWEEFGIVATVLGFIADCVALILLLVSSFPESAAVDKDVWIVFQYTILFLSVISYLGYLRNIWRENFKNTQVSFVKYLVDLLAFDDWVKLIAPLIMLSFLVVISLQVNAFVNILIWGGIIIGVISINSTLQREKRLERNRYDIQRARDTLGEWVPRIDKILANKGYLTSIEMARNFNENEHYCAWVLDYYYRAFIDEKGLMYSEETKYYPNGGSYVFYVVAHQIFAESKPWL